jgi:Tol biopolymer transport system component
LDVANPGSESLLLKGDGEEQPTGWSPDGRLVLHTYPTAATETDIRAVPADGSGKDRPVLGSPSSEDDGIFSPDGSWIAYASDESGRPEIYAQRFPGGSPRTRISAGGGEAPRWRADGREMFYLASDNRVTAVETRLSGAVLEIGPARELFELTGEGYAPSADGQRFLVDRRSESPSIAPCTVILNWAGDLVRR